MSKKLIEQIEQLEQLNTHRMSLLSELKTSIIAESKVYVLCKLPRMNPHKNNYMLVLLSNGEERHSGPIGRIKSYMNLRGITPEQVLHFDYYSTQV